MTSEERRKARYARRVLRRSFKKACLRYKFDQFDKVFNYRTMYKAYRRIRKGVGWKPSTQRYATISSMHIHSLLDKLRRAAFRSDGFHEFDLYERGHARHIRAVNTKERNVQRCFCDNCLTPILSPSFIDDNSATRKGKGYHYAIRRLRKKLTRHIHKYGVHGYILVFDFKNYFGSIPHDAVKRIASRVIQDERLVALLHHLIDCFGEIGLGLGSQISQCLALAIGSRIDHAMTERMSSRAYARYNDDGYIIHRSKSYLYKCLEIIRAIASALGLTLNKKKTKIIKLRHGFTMLKKRFSFKGTRIIMKVCRKSVSRERQKLKKLLKKVHAGRITYKDMYQSFQSWRSYAATGNSWHVIDKMNKFYSNLIFSGAAA